jgi:phosphomannomutase
MKSTGHYKKWFQAMNNNLQTLSCFKAYDIRGKLGDELNEDIAYRIGRAVAQQLKPKTIVVGGDARETSKSLKLAVAKGLQDAGVDVIDIGMVGTEEIYFATSFLKVDGGIEITASHNPINYNGMKLVREQSKPISGDTGLNEIKALAEQQPWLQSNSSMFETKKGSYTKTSNLQPYVDHLLTYIEPENIKPLKLVVNSGNGAAGHVIDQLELQFLTLNIPIEFIKVHHEPDHTFPNGIPNPLLPENRADTANAVIEHKADIGIAWDGDFDRCFLFDERGEFIEGYYIVGLLAEAFLQKNANEKIIYDPRVYWNTEDIIKQNGGIPVMSKTGHAFIKERMRLEDAVYGGEMSAHHYFRDFAYCDSGMIPWLLIAELLCVNRQTISSMVKERIVKYPSSGEINQVVDNPEQIINKIEQVYSQCEGASVDYTDGINISFPDWRFNLRMSNTESVIRLNVEAKGCAMTLDKYTIEILDMIGEYDEAV